MGRGCRNIALELDLESGTKDMDHGTITTNFREKMREVLTLDELIRPDEVKDGVNLR